MKNLNTAALRFTFPVFLLKNNSIMDYSLDDTMKKIKQQEKENEDKLRKKRTYEEYLIATKRNIREALANATKQKQKYSEAILRIQKQNIELSLEKIKSKALAAQLETSKRELEDLKQKSDEGISSVWKIRSTLSEAVQSTSERCDVWALLIKPQNPQIDFSRKKRELNVVVNKDERLRLAQDKLQKLVAERDRLMREPDIGVEFVRIKNALSYSKEKVAALNAGK